MGRGQEGRFSLGLRDWGWGVDSREVVTTALGQEGRVSNQKGRSAIFRS
jgi:hypothetical protein